MRRAMHPGGVGLFGPGILLPNLGADDGPGFFEKDGLKNPAQQRQTEGHSPRGFPNFFPRAHSSPQIALR